MKAENELEYTLKSIVGGISESSIKGYKGAGVQDTLAIDFRTDPDKISLNKKLSKVSSTTVTDFIRDAIAYKGYIFAYGDSGKVYRVNMSTDTWELIATVSQGIGHGIAVFNEALFVATQSGFTKITDIFGVTPVVTENYFDPRTNEVFEQGGGTGQTYTTPTSIAETAAARQTFTPASTYVITGITVGVTAEGTGNVTLTLHDSSNNVLGTATLTAAQVIAASLMRFNFSEAIQLTGSTAYHFHVTSSVADTTIVTNVTNDLEGALYYNYAYFNDFARDQFNDIRLTEVNVAGDHYDLPQGISETATNRQTFVPNYRSLAGIALQIYDAGSNNWTVTVHDDQNIVVGTVTVAAATIGTGKGGMYYFKFATPLTVVPGATYHFHVISSSNGAEAVVTGTNSDLETVGFIGMFNVLKTDTEFHPLLVLGNKLHYGGADLTGWIDDSEVVFPEAQIFSPGERAKHMDTIGDNLITTVQVGTTISAQGDGIMYIWNTVSVNYDAYINTDGQMNTFRNLTNKLFMIHGTQGQISLYTGDVNPMRRMKFANDGVSLEVLAEAIDNFEGLLLFGVSSNSTQIDSGVYSYGRKDKDFPYALNKEYIISTGNKGIAVKIGTILGVGAGKLYVSWKDTTSGTFYGVDKLDLTSDAAYGYFTTLRIDGGEPTRQKVGKSVSLRFEALTATQKFTIKYRLDNSGSFKTLGSFDGATADYLGVTKASLPFEKRFYEVELIIEFYNSAADAPVLYAVKMPFVIKGEEQEIATKPNEE